MSYASCKTSAASALKVDSAEIPYGAVGRIFTPALTVAAAASGVGLDVIAPVVLPKGVYLVAGNVRFDATVGGQTVNGSTSIKVAGVDKSPFLFQAVDGANCPFNQMVSVDGTQTLDIDCLLTTSGGSTYSIVAAYSALTITRIA